MTGEKTLSIEVANKIKKQIILGHLKVGEQIPNEQALIKH